MSGVRDWWLTDLGEAVSEEVVQAALDRLLETGALEARRVPGGAVIYGRSLLGGK